MLWSKKNIYCEKPFNLESELEDAILECKDDLFGENRFYFDVKKKIGKKTKITNIPDGYLLDLSDERNPTIHVVENELARHHSIKHIAIQLLEFSLSYEVSKVKVKKILRDEIKKNTKLYEKINSYAITNNFDNMDYILDRAINKMDSFGVVLIIDELSEELETVLENRLKFPVTIKTFKRYVDKKNQFIYEFEPFDRFEIFSEEILDKKDVDTIVIPARKEGFEEVFIGEECWYAVRIANKMIPKLKYIAAYQVSPISSITHIAEIDSIEQYENTSKYIIYFKTEAKKIDKIELGDDPRKAPQSPRYTNYCELINAENLEKLF